MIYREKLIRADALADVALKLRVEARRCLLCTSLETVAMYLTKMAEQFDAEARELVSFHHPGRRP